VTQPSRPENRAAARRGLRSVTSDQALPWVVRVLWVALPFTVGPALADALAQASGPVQLVAAAGLWAAWAVGVAATLIALPVSLTALRVVAPAALAAAVAATVAGHPSALALGWAGVTAGWVFSPSWGFRCVNGPAYPNERRFLLRAPGPLLFGPLLLAWALVVAAVVAGPLLLASRRWLPGAILTVAGLPLAGILLRGMHDLSRRWAVLVPAGLVLHDPLTIVDPVLFRRQTVTRMGPALAGTTALDLTQKAPGLALEIALDEEVALALVRPGKRLGEAVKAGNLLFTPTRPGALLAEAGKRRLPVG
jgi:hypothetical protein